MKLTYNYLIGNFWEKGLAKQQDGRRWYVASLINGDLWLRDGFAFALLYRKWAGRDDVEYEYMRALEREGHHRQLQPEDDYFFLGRPRLFVFSRLSQFVQLLEGKEKYRVFGSPSDARTSHSVTYKNAKNRRIFSYREMEVDPLDPFSQRSGRDYGILQYRHQEIKDSNRRLLAIAGLSSLGTLGLSVILTDKRRRQQLVDQIQSLAPLSAAHRPDRLLEICVRIEASGPGQLENLLNNLSRGEPAFSFHVEAVAVATTDGGVELQLAVAKHEVRLQPAGEPRRGGLVRLASGGPSVYLPEMRFHLLHQLVENPEAHTPSDLCRALGWNASEKREKDREKGRLIKLVHDLNIQFQKQLFGGNQKIKMIRSEGTKRQGTEGHYVLNSEIQIVME